MPASLRNRFERRRAETRQALVRVARTILADSGGADASIRAIAERADVGFGSCYNHFTGTGPVRRRRGRCAGGVCPSHRQTSARR
jgi:DNA-binding transcriptional regulator YbjK